MEGVNACAALLSNQSSLERFYVNNDGIAAEAGERLAEILLHT
jgi:hypothetical protein